VPSFYKLSVSTRALNGSYIRLWSGAGFPVPVKLFVGHFEDEWGGVGGYEGDRGVEGRNCRYFEYKLR
jgi:hypothetical protein